MEAELAAQLLDGVDIPYAIKQFVGHPEIPFLRRLRRTWSLT